MNCADAERLLPDLLTDSLEASERAAIQAHFATCSACRDQAAELTGLWAGLGLLAEHKPGPELRAGFYTMLACATSDARKPASMKWGGLGQMAAGILVAAGCFLGGYLIHGGPGLPPASQGNLVLLRHGRTDLRMAGVMLAGQGDPEDAAPAEALLDLVDGDPDEMVRLAAVDALYLYGRQPDVRVRLAASLAHQSSPRVQLALVDLLAGLRERTALEALRSLLRSPSTSVEVRRKVQQVVNHS